MAASARFRLVPARILGAVVAVAALLVLIVLADAGRLGPVSHIVMSIPAGDTIAHAVIAAAVAFMLTRCVAPDAGARRLLPAVALLVFLVIEESTQVLVARRAFSWTDMAANILGVALGTMLGLRVWVRKG